MTELVVCLGDESTENYVRKLIDVEQWEKVVIVADEGAKAFTAPKVAKLIVINRKNVLKETVRELERAFSKEVKGIEVAVNIAASDGKTGMAVIAALLGLGKALRLVAWSREGLVIF